MGTFIARFDNPGPGLRLAVKDLIDMEGIPTTAGCRAVAERARPASVDAACLAGARAAGASIVGRTNLHELAFGVTGVNPWFGTPENPLDSALVPGGSSSGSAVAVAVGDADIAFGSDTGGSIRIPSACCGTAGLKTTWGRVPLDGVWPLAPTLDTVGPMARDVSGLEAGMALLEPGFATPEAVSVRIGRMPVDADPAIQAAIDQALRDCEFEIVDVRIPEWDAATAAGGLLLMAEAWEHDREILESHPEGVGSDVAARLRRGGALDRTAITSACEERSRWRRVLEEVFTEVDLIATPTLTIFPPRLDDGENLLMSRCTVPANLAGLPALALPVPTKRKLPSSLQLIGPEYGEERLLAAARVVEAAVSTW